jgi:hypothetical protein
MPTFSLILQIHYLDLNPTLGRTAHRSVQVRDHQLIQIVIALCVNVGETPRLW